MSDYEPDFFFEEDKIPLATYVDANAVPSAVDLAMNATKTGEESTTIKDGDEEDTPDETSTDTDLLVVTLENGIDSIKSESCKDIHFFWSENQL